MLPPSECYWLVNASPLNDERWVGLNYGPIFRRLWTKVHQITSRGRDHSLQCRSPIVNILFRSRDICDRSAKSSEIAPKKHVSLPPNFFGGGPVMNGSATKWRVSPSDCFDGAGLCLDPLLIIHWTRTVWQSNTWLYIFYSVWIGYFIYWSRITVIYCAVHRTVNTVYILYRCASQGKPML